MALKLKTAPAINPVTLADVKLQCRIDDTDSDTLLESYIAAAVSKIDGYAGILGRCLIEQTWELYYDAFPACDLEIPLRNLLSVTSVEYVDPATLLYVTWDAANYEVDAVNQPGWIVPVSGWPSPAETVSAVRVTFKAGYGATAADVPAAIRAAMLMQISRWNEDREGEQELSPAVMALLAPFRVYYV